MSTARTNLFLHESVPDATRTIPNLHRRLGLVLQQLAAHGRTGVVKGCSGANRGWSRSPLGGNGGMQYYLWWMLQDGNILARAVRHHDDHSAISVGDTNDYHSLHVGNIDGLDEAYASSPWTEGQLRFINDGNPVRIVYGHPGSGKTTALWRAVEAHDRRQVLYVSWSRELTRLAKERFDVFAPGGVDVVDRDFVTLLGEICGDDVTRLTYAQSRAAFAEALAQTRLGRADLGPWSDREDALYAELRAILLGRAVPEERGCVPYSEKFWRLNDDEYHRLRGDSDAIGHTAANACLRIADALERHAGTALTRVFPELASASAAIHELRSGRISDGWSNFDCIAVDEIQDLTLAEIAIMVELCRTIAGRRDNAPHLLIAGDSGQTVRPSGFEWPSLNRLLANRLTAPQEFALDTTLRSPKQIATVIERSDELYVNLKRQFRPANRQNPSWESSNEARLFYVEVPNEIEAITLLEQLNEMDALAVVTPGNDVPGWVPEHLRNAVLTPSVVKGLEYQASCVLNPGPLLQELSTEIAEYERAPELEFHYRRTAIDRLRVALSRAAESLIFIDVAADNVDRELSRKLLGDEADVCSPDYLVEHFTDADATTDERVMARISQAQRLIDTAPGRAWELSVQAIRLLSSIDLDNEVFARTVHFEANENLLAIAARLLVDGLPQGVRHDDVVGMGHQAATTLDRADHTNAFHELADWLGRREAPPFGLLDAGITLGDSGIWLSNALPPVLQTLIAGINRYAEDPAYAGRFAGNVEGWLRLIRHSDDYVAQAKELRVTAAGALIEAGQIGDVENWLRIGGYSGEVTEQTKAVRYAAAEALIQAGETENVEQFLLQAEPPDWELRAKLHEAQGRLEAAIAAYEQAQLSAESGRVREILAEMHFAAGKCLLAAQDWDAALDDFERAISVRADNADFYYGKGLAYFYKRDFNRAISAYNEGIAIDANSAMFYGARGLTYLWKNEIGQAIADYDQAIPLDPGDAHFYAGRGYAYTRRCAFELAIHEFDQAIRLDPNAAHFYIWRGRTHRWKGDYDRENKDRAQAYLMGFEYGEKASYLDYTPEW